MAEPPSSFPGNKPGRWILKGREQLCHIFWKRSLKRKIFMGYRMRKFQGIGVEGHSFYFGIVRIIEIISQKGRAQIFHMDPDLVGPACFQRKADERTAFPAA